MNRIKKYCFIIVNSWIINHLGIKPIKGGSPPNDRIFMNNKNFRVFELKNLVKIWLMWNNLGVLNINTTLIDNSEYIQK